MRPSESASEEAEHKSAHDAIRDLRIEIASLRLKLRAVMTYLACIGPGAAADETIVQVCAFLEGTGIYAVAADQIEPAVRDAAHIRARARMRRMSEDLHKMPIATRCKNAM